LRKTPDEVVAEIVRIRAARDAAGSRTRIEVGMSTAFGCTIQGHVAPAEVVRLVGAVLDAGVDCVSLADTVGYADPAMVRSLFAQVRAVAGDKLTAAHFHDTRGLGLANVYAALESGITRFDACLGGIGGCPHAPGASGNITTEDLVFMLESMGISTGTDLPQLLALRERLAGWLAESGTSIISALHSIARSAPFRFGTSTVAFRPGSVCAKASTSAVSASCGSSRAGTNEPTSISRWPAS
jgi:hydroxymethylglutaryl-CoA lyase